LDWGIIAQRYKEMFGHKCIWEFIINFVIGFEYNIW
jgi:hypothetical protein